MFLPFRKQGGSQAKNDSGGGVGKTVRVNPTQPTLISNIMMPMPANVPYIEPDMCTPSGVGPNQSVPHCVGATKKKWKRMYGTLTLTLNLPT